MDLRTPSSQREMTKAEKEKSNKARAFVKKVNNEFEQAAQRAANIKRKYAEKRRQRRQQQEGKNNATIALLDHYRQQEAPQLRHRRVANSSQIAQQPQVRLGCKPNSTNAACLLTPTVMGAAAGGIKGACVGAACGAAMVGYRKLKKKKEKINGGRRKKTRRKTRKHKKRHRRRKSTHKHKRNGKKRRRTKKR